MIFGLHSSLEVLSAEWISDSSDELEMMWVLLMIIACNSLLMALVYSYELQLIKPSIQLCLSMLWCLFCRRTNTRLDIGKLSQLTSLKRLQLRAACAGLQLPAFTFSGGLPSLACLTQLKKLVRQV